MADLFPITISDQIREVEREIAFRIRVYARMVSDGRLTQEKADRQLAVMRAVLGTLESAPR